MRRRCNCCSSPEGAGEYRVRPVSRFPLALSSAAAELCWGIPRTPIPPSRWPSAAPAAVAVGNRPGRAYRTTCARRLRLSALPWRGGGGAECCRRCSRRSSCGGAQPAYARPVHRLQGWSRWVCYSALASGCGIINSVYDRLYAGNRRRIKRVLHLFCAGSPPPWASLSWPTCSTLFLFYEMLTLSNPSTGVTRRCGAADTAPRVYLGVLLCTSLWDCSCRRLSGTAT